MPEFKTVSQLAYELWEKGGRREGTAEQNWLEAERILANAARVVAPVTASKARLTASAIDQLLTAPVTAPPVVATARARKSSTKAVNAKPTAGKAAPKPSRKRATSEPPKVGSRDAPGG